MPGTQRRNTPLTKSKNTPQRRETENTEPKYEEVWGNAGENAAPDNPSHLMPSMSGSVSTDQVVETDSVDDLDADELAARGYPDPEVTPLESMGSTRQNGTFVEQQKGLVRAAHDALTDKLDTIGRQVEIRDQQKLGEDELSDYADIPGAPKDGLILGPNEPLRVSGEQHGNVVVLDKNVYRAKKPFRTKRWSFQLLAVKGSTVQVAKLHKLNETEPTEPQKTDETKGGHPVLEKPHDAESTQAPEGTSETK